MKILVLSPLTPLKQHGGLQNRVWNTWKRMSKSHDITMLCFDDEITKYLLKKIENIDFHLLPLNNSISRFPKSLFTGVVPPFYRFNNNEVLNKANSLIKQNHFDLIIADHFWLADTVLKIKSNIKKICLSHGFEYTIYQRLGKEINFFHKMIVRILSRNQKKAELAILNKFDYISCINNDELQQLKNNNFDSNKLFVMPNGISLENIRHPENKDSDIFNLVFLGSMNYEPNDDAMKYFIYSILPKLKEINNNIKLTIIGNKPSQWLIDITKNNNIEVTGFIDNINSYFNSNTICIAPLRIGSGSRIKILEYWAHSMPVVATTIGAEGLNYKHGHNIIIADNSTNFSKAISDLIKDHNKKTRLGINGRDNVEKYYNWDNIIKNFNSKLNFITDNQE